MTLEGPQAQLSPTHLVLPVIEQAAAQGEDIPVDIQPITSTSAVVIQNLPPPPPIVIPVAPMAQPGAQIQTQLVHPPQQAGGQAQQQAQPAGQQQQAAQPAHINVNGALKGNPPTPFDGTRSKSSGFLVTFNLFRAANRHNEAMSNPYSHVTTALTYMTGDVMEPWKEDQLNLLNDRITAGYQDDDEQLWNLFEADFRQAFTNTHKAKDAQRELKNLSQKDNLDTYISEFKRLARDSGYPLNDVGTIELFKRGLKKGLFDAIIDSDVYDPAAQNPWNFERWAKEAIKQPGKWKEKVSFKDNYRTGLYKAFGVKKNPNNNGRKTTSHVMHGHCVIVITDTLVITELRST